MKLRKYFLSHRLLYVVELCEELQAGKAEVESQLLSARATISTIADEVNELKAEREAVHELKTHVEEQHKALTDGANQSEKSRSY